jgi:hypothetical protein
VLSVAAATLFNGDSDANGVVANALKPMNPEVDGVEDLK